MSLSLSKTRKYSKKTILKKLTSCIVYTPCHDVSGRYIKHLLNVSEILTEIPDQILSYSTKYCDEYGKWNATVSDACKSEVPMETSTFITMVQANTTIVFCMHVLSVVLTTIAFLAVCPSCCLWWPPLQLERIEVDPPFSPCRGPLSRL